MKTGYLALVITLLYATNVFAENILDKFQSVIDTLNVAEDNLVQSEYFLYDITGDDIPELWIRSGSCEADIKLIAYTLDHDKPRKIYEGYGGHSDYFIFEGEFVCVMCNTGAGAVITYKYVDGVIEEDVVEFSTWDDDAKEITRDNKASRKLEYWENNPDNFIILTDLSK